MKPPESRRPKNRSQYYKGKKKGLALKNQRIVKKTIETIWVGAEKETGAPDREKGKDTFLK